MRHGLGGISSFLFSLHVRTLEIRRLTYWGQDAIFDNMTHAKWSRAFLPKTLGSRNLLAQLSPADAPFFILLSSITGIIGNTAQANYASGNTFEDALAQYARSHLSIAATSIDVGLVADSSHFTATGGFGELENYLHKYQHGWAGLQTSQEELRVVLKAVMRGSTADGQKVPAQLVLGLGDRLVREPGSAGFERDRKFELRMVSPEGNAAGGEGQENGVSVGERLGTATTIGEAAMAVEDNLKGHIAVDTGIDFDEVDGQKPLPEFGGAFFPPPRFFSSLIFLLLSLILMMMLTYIASNSGLPQGRRDAEPHPEGDWERCLRL